MIIVTHEVRFARDVADRIVFIDDGVIVEEGAPKQVLDQPKQERTRRFLRMVAHEDAAAA
jgi:polar amino acid transport system permease protein